MPQTHVLIAQKLPNIMQSGSCEGKSWTIRAYSSQRSYLSALMGWVAGGDTQAQVVINFSDKEQAIDFAKKAVALYRYPNAPNTDAEKTYVNVLQKDPTL